MQSKVFFPFILFLSVFAVPVGASEEVLSRGTRNLASWLYVEAEKLPASIEPGETPEEFRDRLRVIVESLAVATVPYGNGKGWTRTELAVAVLILWNEESRFDRRIHAGEKHPRWTQDFGKARCLGQIHASERYPSEVWSALAGTDREATLRCAHATVALLVSAGRGCGSYLGVRANPERVAKAFSGYATGGNCGASKKLQERAQVWLRVMARRPDRSPLPGYQRVPPGGLVPEVRVAAERLRGMIGTVKPGHVEELPGGWKLLVEKHAAGKVGVSVFKAEMLDVR